MDIKLFVLVAIGFAAGFLISHHYYQGKLDAMAIERLHMSPVRLTPQEIASNESNKKPNVQKEASEDHHEEGSSTEKSAEENLKASSSSRMERSQHQDHEEPAATLVKAAKPADYPMDIRDTDEFLKNQRLAKLDALDEIPKSFAAKKDLVVDLNGFYAGAADVLIDGKAKSWYIEMNFTGGLKNGLLGGRFKIDISENGKVFSAKDSSGDNIPDFRDYPQDDNVLMVQVAPNTVFQMYYLDRLRMFIGNIYRRHNTEKFYRPIGTFKLEHQ